MQDRNGKLCVFIDCMSDDYVGTYTCVAVNDEGETSMKIKLLIAGMFKFLFKKENILISLHIIILSFLKEPRFI